MSAYHSIRHSKILALIAILLIAVSSFQAVVAAPEAALASLTQKKFIPNDAPGDAAGFSVAISEGSRTAIMGAYAADNEDTADTGAAFIFLLPENNWAADWIQQARLVASDGVNGDRFGISVAMSDDGNTVVVGADRADANGHTDQGAAYVFTRSGETWTEQAKLTHTTGVDSARMGWSVAISPDGNTILAGAYQADIAGYEDQGAGHVFVRSGENWSYQASLTLNTEGNYMGYSVSLSEDGNMALLGAPGYNGAAGNDQGMAAIFKRTGSSWAYQVGLTASDAGAGDWLGRSVSMDDNGVGALVGASLATVSGHAEQGAAYLFKYSSGWAQEKKFTAATGEAYDHFGVSVSLADDSEVVMIGAYQADMNGKDDSGAVYYQEKHSGIWGDPYWYNPGTSAGSRFGVSVALGWGDGWSSIVGADAEDSAGYNHPPTLLGQIQEAPAGNVDQGAAFIITQSTDPEWDLKDALLGSNDAYAYFGEALVMDSAGDYAFIGAPSTDINGVDDQGAVYVSSYVAGIGYVQETRLTVAATHSNALYGTSVDCSDDGLTLIVGAPGAYVGGVNQGAAYVYVKSGSDWVLQGTLTHTGLSGDAFGSAVTIGGEGNHAVVGAPMVDIGGDGNVGKAYVFRRSGGIWMLSTTLERPLNAGAQFGKAVEIGGDAGRIMVGSRETVSGHASQGAVHDYYYSDTEYHYAGAITSLDGVANDYFGTTITMDENGIFAFISAPSKLVGGVAQGQVYFFHRSGDVWSLKQVLSEGGSQASFGQSLKINNDGDLLVIGAPGVDIEGQDNLGTAYYYKYTLGGWALVSILTAMDGNPFAGFGRSVSVINDGTRVMVGADEASWGGLSKNGSAYYFSGGFANGRIYLPLLKRQ